VTQASSGPLTQKQLAELQRKLKSRTWRLNNLYRIQDKDGQEVLFRLNKVQQDLDSTLHTRNVILKSRQHGITTWACIRALDTALFRSNTSCGIVADTKEHAEKFFREKVLFAYDRLPQFLRDARPIKRKDMTGELVLENGSKIVVGVSLRSGTYQRLHVSELGPMDEKEPRRSAEVVSGAMNTVPPNGIVTVESTARGAAGEFYLLCKRAMAKDAMVHAGTASLTAMDYKLYFLPWFADPTNVMHEHVELSERMVEYFEKVEAETGARLTDAQKSWYAKKAEEQREQIFAEHPSTPDEAFYVSSEGTYYAKDIARAELDGRIRQLPFIPGIPVNTFWDLGRNDTTAIWFHQQVGPWHNFINYVEHSGEGAAYYARELQRIGDKFGYVYGEAYLPHDGANADWSQGDNRTRAQVLEDLGVKRIVIVERIQNVNDGIDMVRQVLPMCRFDAKRCGENPEGSGRGGLPSLKAYRKAWNDRGQCFASTPMHNWASNGSDAFRQFAQAFQSKVTPAGNKPRQPNNSSRAVRERWKTA